MTKRVALYLRVSTDEQTLDNQRRELEAVSARNDWEIVATYEDNGISGAKGRDRRPGFDSLCKAVTRREIDLAATASAIRRSCWPREPENRRPSGSCLRPDRL